MVVQKACNVKPKKVHFSLVIFMDIVMGSALVKKDLVICKLNILRLLDCMFIQ